MQLFEILFLLCTLLLLIQICFFGNSRRLQVWTLYAGILLMALHASIESLRWQMSLGYLVFLLTALFILKRSVGYLFFRITGFLFGVLLLSTTFIYAQFMPIIDWPEPTGNLTVGTTSFCLTDNSRNEEFTTDPNDHRELFVEIWYPAESFNPAQPKPLWNELYSGDNDQISFFTEYLSQIQTHSFEGAPIKMGQDQFPLLLFNHGYQMFTSQNTILMEELTSHGYVVVSIGHPFESLKVNLEKGGTILPKFIQSFEEFGKAMAWIQESSMPIEAAQDSLNRLSSKQERAKLMLETIRDSPMNAVVERWEADTRFVLNQITQSDLRQEFQQIIDTSRIGVFGMSIGGAVSAELAKSDPRIKAAINMDGLQYGTKNDQHVNVPFLMINSEDGKGLNPFLSMQATGDFHEVTFLGSKHADFTDMPMIWPIMGLYGQLGQIPPQEMTRTTHQLILNFWDSYLKESKERFQIPSAGFIEQAAVSRHEF